MSPVDSCGDCGGMYLHGTPHNCPSTIQAEAARDFDTARLDTLRTRIDALKETRAVDPVTGGEKGTKLARFDLIPVVPLEAVATHYGIGATKYEDRNWERGYRWSYSFAAMMRHAWAFWRGEDIDPETGSPHLAAVVFHALALMEYGDTNRANDDRVPCGRKARR